MIYCYRKIMYKQFRKTIEYYARADLDYIALRSNFFLLSRVLNFNFILYIYNFFLNISVNNG